MRALQITNTFALSLRELSLRYPDSVHWANSIYKVASQVAAGRSPTWCDDHPLRGAYKAYRSFKPLGEDPDLMVVYTSAKRSITLVDIGVHKRFFTKGRKTKMTRLAKTRANLE